MLVVAGLSLANLKPTVWDPRSPYHLPNLHAVMLSYADFHRARARRTSAMELGLQAWLGAPTTITVYLDNGAFYFLNRHEEVPTKEYEEFVREAGPAWYPIPRDYIPTPRMSPEERRLCVSRTMAANRAYEHDGYVPVIHIGEYLRSYTTAILRNDQLARKPAIALGGIVPNLLRTRNSMAYADILAGLRHMRAQFRDKSLHVFGIGGTATIHIAALLEFDSVDSAGWRNRAARGIVQLPGRGDRMVANLGAWRGRKPSDEERELLAACACPGCVLGGITGLAASGLTGFSQRATHNLWVLLQEAHTVDKHLAAGTYADWYGQHVTNSVYRPIIDQLVEGRYGTRGRSTK